ncbi:MAG: hypothetical protein KF723_23120 [Rhizobiaceae bacterium]|nr:hypothetical protein [Rhizobiaceae bacterium]
MAELLVQLAGLVVIALWWAVTFHSAITGVRSGRHRPEGCGKAGGPKWGSFGPL